jgi:hypothetical protein
LYLLNSIRNDCSADAPKNKHELFVVFLCAFGFNSNNNNDDKEIFFVLFATTTTTTTKSKYVFCVVCNNNNDIEQMERYDCGCTNEETRNVTLLFALLFSCVLLVLLPCSFQQQRRRKMCFLVWLQQQATTTTNKWIDLLSFSTTNSCVIRMTADLEEGR